MVGKTGRPPKPAHELATAQVKFWMSTYQKALWQEAKQDDRFPGDFSDWVKWVISIYLRDKERAGWVPQTQSGAAPEAGPLPPEKKVGRPKK